MTTHLVTTLKREATKILREVKKSKLPVLITEYGKPAAYLIDAQVFIDTQEKIAILEKIARGEKAIQDKRVISHSTAQKMMKKWAV